MSERPAFPAGNNTVLHKGPCTSCSSSDGMATYADGHTFCFVCSSRTEASPSDAGDAVGDPKAPHPGRVAGGDSPALKPGPGAFDRLPKRGLETATLRRFGYFQAGFKGQTVHAAPYFDQDGEPAGQKLRSPSKEFMVLKAHDNAPSIGDGQLFGRHVFGDRYDRKVVVTEGELDAMSVAQADDFEPRRVSRRLQLLRGWSHDEANSTLFP